jgi:hypothetical protein
MALSDSFRDGATLRFPTFSYDEAAGFLWENAEFAKNQQPA